MVFELQGSNYKITISSLTVDAGGGETTEVPRAWLKENTAFIFLNAGARRLGGGGGSFREKEGRESLRLLFGS